MWERLDEYAHVGQGKDVNYGHLSSTKMVLLKLVRSVWCPDVEDNYVDSRNYVSIAEMTTRIDEDEDIWSGTERRNLSKGIFD